MYIYIYIYVYIYIYIITYCSYIIFHGQFMMLKSELSWFKLYNC